MLQFLLISSSTCFDFQTPTSALHHFFLLTVPCFCPPTFNSVYYHFSLSLSLLSLSSFLYICLLSTMSFAIMIICCHRPGQRIRQGRGGKACYSFLPSVWHVWRMEIWSRRCCNFSPSIWVGRREREGEPGSMIRGGIEVKRGIHNVLFCL